MSVLNLVRSQIAFYGDECEVRPPACSLQSDSRVNNPQDLHARAVAISSRYLKSEAELVGVLGEMDECRGYFEFSCASLFEYSTRKLNLSESVALNMIAVIRKSREVPDLGRAVQDGTLSISKARKITSVLTQENKALWIELAQTSSARAIEKAVATENPKLAVVESVKYVNGERMELRLGISEEFNEQLRHLKNLLSQKKQRAVTTEEALELVVADYDFRHDPVMKANRAVARRAKKSSAPANSVKHNGSSNEAGCASLEKIRQRTNQQTSAISPHLPQQDTQQQLPPKSPPNKKHARTYIPSAIRHALFMRDLNQCTHHAADGSRCPSKRWLHIHHIKPVDMGGTNELENLTTLCSGHHRAHHSEQ